MNNNAAEKKDNLVSEVKIVDGKLILSLPNAQMPVVWQMDIEKAQSAAFTVKEDKKKKIFSFVVKKEDGEVDEIAVFDTKEGAVEVLMETSSALQNAHGKIKSGVVANSNDVLSSGGSSTSKDEGSDKLGAFLAVSLVIVLIVIWSISSSVPQKVSGVSAASTESGNIDARQSSGVPVSADDFLSKR